MVGTLEGVLVPQEAIGWSRVQPLGLGRWQCMGTSRVIQVCGARMLGRCDAKADPRSFQHV